MKSGNKVSFKNMGSSPVKHGTGTRHEHREDGKSILHGPEGKVADEAAWEAAGAEERGIGIEGMKEKYIDKTTNKESKWDFDFMQLLDSFLTSGVGKKGLLKAAGAALRSPNERLEAQKKRELKKVKQEDITTGEL